MARTHARRHTAKQGTRVAGRARGIRASLTAPCSAALLAIIALLSGCGGPGPGATGSMPNDPTNPMPMPRDVRGVDDDEALDPEDVQVNRSLGIPPGHLPPPGKCRVWQPDQPPGQQPPPQPCGRARAAIGPGDWLLERTWRQPARVRVVEHAPQPPAEPILIRIYAVDDGTFLGEREPEGNGPGRGKGRPKRKGNDGNAP